MLIVDIISSYLSANA